MQNSDEDRSGRLQRGKILAMNFDAYNDLPGDTCLYCLTDKQQMILLALVEQLGWPTRWYSPSGATIDRAVLEGYRGDLAAALMSDVCQEIFDKLDYIKSKVDDIRSKEDDLETAIETFSLETGIHLDAQDVVLAAIASDVVALSAALAVDSAAIAGIAALLTTTSAEVHEVNDDVDNIENILTDGTNGLVEVSQDVDAIELAVAALQSNVTSILIQNNVTINNVSVINNVTFTVNNSDDETSNYARWIALCQACIRWVMDTGYRVAQTYFTTPSYLTDILNQLIAVGGQVTGNPIPNPALVAELSLYNALMSASDVDALACHMQTTLAPLAIDYANFAAALNGFSPANANQTILYNLCLTGVILYNAYTSFVSMLGDEYQKQLALAPTGYVSTCCNLVPSITIYRFFQGNKNPWIIVEGVLRLGYGVVSVNTWVAVNTAYHANDSIKLKLAGTLGMRHVKLVMTDDGNTEGRSTSGANRQIVLAITVAGVRTTSVLTATANATSTLDWNLGSLVFPTLIEIYSNLYVWNHWFQSVELTT